MQGVLNLTCPKCTFDVLIERTKDPANISKVTYAVMDLTNLDYWTAQKLLWSLPAFAKKNIDKEEAELIKCKLEEVGAEVSIKKHDVLFDESDEKITITEEPVPADYTIDGLDSYSDYDIIIEKIKEPSSLSKVTYAVVELTGLDYWTVQKLLWRTPAVIERKVKRERAGFIKRKLEAVGAEVSIKNHTSDIFENTKSESINTKPIIHDYCLSNKNEQHEVKLDNNKPSDVADVLEAVEETEDLMDDNTEETETNKRNKKIIFVPLIAVLLLSFVVSLFFLKHYSSLKHKEYSSEEIYYTTIDLMRSDMENHTDKTEKIIDKNIAIMGLKCSSVGFYEKRKHSSTYYRDKEQMYKEVIEPLFDGKDKISASDVVVKYGYNPKINADVIDAYISQHSIESFIESLGIIQKYYDCADFGYHKCIEGDFDCYCPIAVDLFQALVEVPNIEICHATDYSENCEGYYTEHPDANPHSSSTENTVTGKFNNASDGNSVYSKSKKFNDTSTVQYYGDFAIVKSISHGYSQGRYEWVNGVFYDEPAHYTTSTSFLLYYKGEYIDLCSSFNLPDLYLIKTEQKTIEVNIESESEKVTLDYDRENRKWIYGYIMHYYLEIRNISKEP
jgi:ribosomal protein L7/L12